MIHLQSANDDLKALLKIRDGQVAELREEMEKQKSAADHWMEESCEDNNRAIKAEAEAANLVEELEEEVQEYGKACQEKSNWRQRAEDAESEVKANAIDASHANDLAAENCELATVVDRLSTALKTIAVIARHARSVANELDGNRAIIRELDALEGE